MKFTVTLPPTENHAYIITYNRKRILTKEAKDWQVDAGYRAIYAKRKQGWSLSQDEWLVMELYFFFPNRLMRDSHNMLKVLLDAFEGILYANDRYVLPRIMEVMYDKQDPRLEIHLYRKEGYDDYKQGSSKSCRGMRRKTVEADGYAGT